MLIYRRTSILESNAQTLVNTVNCVGVMGKGLAHAFKEREPGMFAAYKDICDRKALEPGKLWLWKGINGWVLNFPTKKHWRHPSKIEWIEAGLAKFASQFEMQGITEISFPQLGCGNGGLEWNDVRPLMERYLIDLPIVVYVHDYSVDVGLPEHMEKTAKKLVGQHVTDWMTFHEVFRKAVDVSEGRFTDLSSNEDFRVCLRGDDELLIENSEASWIFDQEDIRGLWLKLTKGLVTKDRASRLAGGGGSSLVSMLSVMPHVRPVQIERSRVRGSFGPSEPEVAVELDPSAGGVVSLAKKESQRELEWH